MKSLWIDIDFRDVADAIEAGESTLKISCCAGEDVVSSAEVTVDVLDAVLPPQELVLTQWFHCDGLAQYYNCDVWSERHWEIIENLGLKRYDDDQFGDNFVRCKIEIREILSMLNNRSYKRNGVGGMFPLLFPEKNQKKVEIWYQMQAYINEEYRISEFDE